MKLKVKPLNSLLLILTMLVSSNLMAQVNLDSLWGVWEDAGQADTARMSAMNRLIYDHYLFRDADSAVYFSHQLYEFAQAKQSTAFIATALNVRGIACIVSGNYQMALTVLRQCLSFSEGNAYEKGMGDAYCNIGNTFLEMGSLDSANKYFELAIPHYAIIKDAWGESACLGNLASVAHQQGRMYQALDYQYRCMKLDEAIGNKMGAISTLNNLGIIHDKIDDDEKALHYYSRCLEESIENGYSFYSGISYQNIGTLHEESNRYDLALESYRKSLLIKRESGDQTGEAITLNSIGLLNLKLGQREKARKCFEEAMAIGEMLANSSVLSTSWLNLGELETVEGNYQKAEQFFEMGLKTSISNGIVENMVSCYKSLSKINKALGNHRKALEMYELHIQMRDSIMSEENQREVIRQEYKYDYEKQALADSLEFAQQQALKDVELEKQELSISRQRIALASSGIGLALIIALSFSIYKGKQRAERAERHKEQFLANMSHEIRTPMHAISGMTKILQRSEPMEKQKRYLNAISESAGNLLVILNDILDLSKVEEGKLNVEQIPTDPKHITENVVGMLRAKADEKGVDLSYSIDENVPQLIQGDPTRLNQILLNLVGNAIKFTEKGSVDVNVGVNGDNLRYSVKDTGIGIPQDKLESVFASFEQVDASTTRKFGGTGLGLSITKKLVELQGGRIWAESELGKGSAFHFELPLIATSEQATSQELSDDQLIEMGKSLGKVRILLAEDDDFNVMVATDDLKYYLPDSIVEVARNGEQAVEQYRNSEYDLVLMDIHMPQMGGLDATKQIRQYEKEKGVYPTPIIAMTASLLKEELERCYSAGMNSYIPKPYKIHEMVSTIHKQMEG